MITKISKCNVELDIFSGRANPAWSLTEDQVRSLVHQLNECPGSSYNAFSGNMGYRGFIIQMDDIIVYVQDGYIKICEKTNITYYYDQGRKIESWLRDTGVPHLDTEIINMITIN